MKKFIFLSVCYLIINSIHAQSTNPAPYCMSGYTSTSMYPEISKVEMASIINVTTHTAAPAYTYYNNLPTCTVGLGSSQTIKVTFKNVDMETILKGWIDYNKNNIFESTELVISIPQGSVGTGMAIVKQANFSVPLAASTGTLRMRVSLGWHYANWPTTTFKLDSCHVPTTGDGSAGETEDYDIVIPSTTGLNRIVNNNDIRLFPNPSSTFIDINGELKEKIIFYSVIDRLGREIILSDKFPISVEDLPKDLYVIKFKLKTDQVVYTKLLVD